MNQYFLRPEFLKFVPIIDFSTQQTNVPEKIILKFSFAKVDKFFRWEIQGVYYATKFYENLFNFCL